MPPKRKSVGDPLGDQVYSKPPAPKRQAKPTAPKKTITYGKRKVQKLSRETLNREYNQATVTQIWKDEVPETGADGSDLEDLLREEHTPLAEEITIGPVTLPLQEDEDDGSGEYGAKPRATKVRQKSAREATKPLVERKSVRKSTGNIPKSESIVRKTRRRTEGDRSPEEKTRLQQQTMTQWHRSFTETSDTDSEGELAPELKLDEEMLEKSKFERSIYDVPSSSQSLHLPTNVPRLSGYPEPPRSTSPQRNGGPSSEMGPPQTPHRVQPREIPSSQSPTTPLSLPSRGSSRKRNPLRERSNNTPSPLQTHGRLYISPEKLPKMEIEDTFNTDTHASQLSRIPTTPLKRSSPAKSVRFALQEEEKDDEDEDEEEEEEEEEPQIETVETPTKNNNTSIPLSQDSKLALRLEVFDSDADTDDEDTVLPENGTGREETQLGDSKSCPRSIVEETEDQESQELVYHEEQEEPETYYEGFGEETQIEVEKFAASSSSYDLNDQEEDEVGDGTEDKTQMMESQRLSFQNRKAMAPITSESDVFISLHPSKVTEIINRTRDHEMRNWRLPPPVRRLWIYETAPIKAVKYMAEIDSLRLPGQIRDERGLENAAFNARRKSSSWVAYEILQVYELSDMQSWLDLKSKGWLNQPPTKFSKVAPAVAGELIYNLKSPLFMSDGGVNEPTSSLTDTQEAEAQLLSTIKQYTQPDLPLLHSSNQAIEMEQEELIPSVIRDSSPILGIHNHENFPVPSQATTVDLTQAQTPRHQSIVEVICESPSRPVPSSSVKMPTPMSRASDNQVHESLFPFTLASSQLMTKSQMLPDSLLDDSLAIPAPLIRDSDDEDD